MNKRLRYALETVAAYVVYGLFRLLPLETASDTGGRIMRFIGPRLGATRIARRNIERALPGLDPEPIILGMWDNLGRVAAEYAHLHRIWRCVEIHGLEHLESARGRAALFFSGHIANWEVNAVAAMQNGVDISLVYRKPNNPGVDGLLRHARDSGGTGHIRKGREGAREILSILKKGGAVGMLLDQKMNEGLAVPFFGHDAMTAPAIAHFALRLKCPIYPSRVERIGGAKFRMTLYPPLDIKDTGDLEADTRAILLQINTILEDWVRERPGQWLWIHRRWPS